VAEAVKGAPINQTLWDDNMRHVQTLNAALLNISTPINDPRYIFQNYDTFKMQVKDLAKFKGIDIRKILDGILKTQNIVLHDSDPILADHDYLNKLGGVLESATKR